MESLTHDRSVKEKNSLSVKRHFDPILRMSGEMYVDHTDRAGIKRLTTQRIGL